MEQLSVKYKLKIGNTFLGLLWMREIEERESRKEGDRKRREVLWELSKLAL